MKTCFKCGASKPTSEFYPHKKMADGLLGKCKSCTRRDVTANRDLKIVQYRAYDMNRSRLADRRARVAMNARSARGKNIAKIRARARVNYAVKSGKMEKGPCAVCGVAKTQAHHEDYSKPLEVVWLCKDHHWDEHRAKSRRAHHDATGSVGP